MLYCAHPCLVITACRGICRLQVILGLLAVTIELTSRYFFDLSRLIYDLPTIVPIYPFNKELPDQRVKFLNNLSVIWDIISSQIIVIVMHIRPTLIQICSSKSFLLFPTQQVRDTWIVNVSTR